MELIGRRFGHIRITDVVGQGGMGDVYAGYDEKLDRKVALKVLHAENRLDAEARERLLREARALSKLDHPNICRIHDYIESSDVDVLVLEYIDGLTLQDVILDQQLSRGEKLRIAVSVAEVLVAAHRVGIIHRDLKPENVMLTRHGQVKVLDFGLARWLNVLSTNKRMQAVGGQAAASAVAIPDDSNNLWFPIEQGGGGTAVLPRYDSTPPEIRRQFMGTAVGVTMGTPLYMSPEQARGEELTTASDLFAFGLLLQALFTGAEPHPPGLTAREVILRAARGETAAVHGADGDVTALINRLKQFAPADRPTAVEAVARLRFMQDKTRRIVRRSAIAAAILIVVLGVWRYTVDLARERTIAVNARAEAERRRAQAEDLINFMVGDLRTKLEPVGRLDVLDGVAEKALQYVGSSKKELASTEELIAHSKALSQLGNVRVEQGNLTAAMPLFEQSLDRAVAAVTREPQNDEAKFTLAISRFWMANAYRKKDDIPRALEHAREYLTLTSGLAARHPANDKYQLEAGYAHSLNGLLLEANRDFRGAIAEYRTTLAIKNAYAARHPADDAAKEDIARTINKLAFALQKSGDLQSARRYFEEEVAARQRLVGRNPKQMRWKGELAISHSFLAFLLDDLGEVELALRHRMAELTLNDELVEHDPANTTWRRNRAAGRSFLGRLLAAKGDFEGGVHHLRAAEETFRMLVDSDPTRPMWRGDLARVKLTFARVLLAKGDIDGARRRAQEAVQISQDEVNRRTLGYAHLMLGYVREREGQTAAARASWLNAAELIQPNDVAATPPRELEQWARVLIALDRRDEAAPVVARLRRLGFRNQEFETLSRSEGY
ncbi:MAG TPA: protein kinase [Thermoanaerobaculia bacterium]|nr:protein kinase [Thermoanaerobaculia bacterium]